MVTVTLRVPLLDRASRIPSQWCCENPFGDATATPVWRPLTAHRRDRPALAGGRPITAGQIGERLGISAAGVRRHLDALIDAGDAEANAAAVWQHNGRGRPAKRYRFTAAGRAKLESHLRRSGGRGDAPAAGDRRRRGRPHLRAPPHRHDPVRRRRGPERRRSDCRPCRRRADRRRLRDHHHAGSRADRRRSDLPASLSGSHLAEELPELCETEREAFAEILGTHVQRLATIVNGDCACTTHVPLDKPTTLRRTARVEATPTPQGAST